VIARLDELGARKPVVIVLAIVVLTAVFLQARFAPFTADTTNDALSYYYAAVALKAGLDPYDAATLRVLAPEGSPFIFPYLYPPILALLWSALTWLGPVTAHHSVMVLSTLLAGLNMVLLWRIIRPPRRQGTWLLAFIAFHLICGPVISTLRIGQVNIMLGSLVFGALLAEKRDKPLLAGFLLALSILVKITPFIFLIDLVIRGRWRSFAATCGWAVTMALLTLPWIGLGPWLSFMTRAREPLPFNPAISIKGIVSAFAGAASIPNFVALILVLAGITLLLWRLYRRLPVVLADYRDPAAGWSMLSLLSLLAFPLTWHHHYYIALLPFGYFVPRACATGGAKRWVWVVAALLALLRYPNLQDLLGFVGGLHVLRPIGGLIAFFAI